MKKITLYTVILICFYPWAIFSAPAITPGTIPNVSNPGLINQRFGRDLPPTHKKIAPISKVEAPQQQAVKSEFEKIQFKLNKVLFKGNTVYTDDELRAIFKQYLGKTISLAKLQELVAEVTKKYRGQGYIISRAILPPQVIKGGEVTVQIIEGYISDVKIEGDPGKAKRLFLSYGNKIEKLRPLQMSYLERYMLLMNDLPGVIIKSVITPSKNIPGGADLTLVVERTKASATYSYDDYGTRYIGPQQISLSGTLYSMGLPADSNTLRYVTVPQNTELNFIEFTHTNPVGENGTRFALGGNYVETHPLFTLQPLIIKGRSNYLFTDLSYPVIRTRAKNLYSHGALNYQNVTSTILGGPFYDDRTRSIVLGGSFDSFDSWKGSNNISLDFEHGFKILGAEKHVNQSRPLGVPNFSKFTLNGSRLQLLTERLSLLVGIYGQYSFNPLLASEQYSYGGPDYGRGYDPSEIVGDDGLAGKIEMRLNFNPEWKWLHALQGYIFYDAGEIWNRDGQSLPAKQSGTSTGFGMRFNFIPQVTGNFYLAKALTKPVATLVLMDQNGGQFRTFFQVVVTV